MCQNVQGLRHSSCMEIAIVLKIAMESITLELCDWRDYFVSSLLEKKTD